MAGVMAQEDSLKVWLDGNRRVAWEAACEVQCGVRIPGLMFDLGLREYLLDTAFDNLKRICGFYREHNPGPARRRLRAALRGLKALGIIVRFDPLRQIMRWGMPRDRELRIYQD